MINKMSWKDKVGLTDPKTRRVVILYNLVIILTSKILENLVKFILNKTFWTFEVILLKNYLGFNYFNNTEQISGW